MCPFPCPHPPHTAAISLPLALTQILHLDPTHLLTGRPARNNSHPTPTSASRALRVHHSHALSPHTQTSTLSQPPFHACLGPPGLCPEASPSLAISGQQGSLGPAGGACPLPTHTPQGSRPSLPLLSGAKTVCEAITALWANEYGKCLVHTQAVTSRGTKKQKTQSISWMLTGKSREDHIIHGITEVRVWFLWMFPGSFPCSPTLDNGRTEQVGVQTLPPLINFCGGSCSAFCQDSCWWQPKYNCKFAK